MKIDFKLKIKNFKLLTTLISSLFVGVYFLTRLFHLTIIPVFCDEAIYIRWAQVMRAVQSLRFLPLSDGKQPLFMWLVIPFLKVFSDPLIAGRMVSVLAGLGTMAGVVVLSYLLFKKKEISLFASFLYLIVPFTFFFDRMALADGLLMCLGVWYLVLVVSLVKTHRLDLAMLAGIILGLALITKSPAIFFILLLPLSFFLKQDSKITIKQWRRLLKLLSLWVVILLFGYSIYNILRLGPEFHMIAIRNKDYVYSFTEVLNHPFNPLLGNLKSAAHWYFILLTPLILLSGLAGIFLLIKKNFKEGIFLFLWWILPLLGQSAIARVYTARYVLYTIPVFLIFSAVALEKLWRETKNKGLVVGGLVMVFFLPMYQSFLLITNPQKAWLPKEERKGYLEIWTAGYGIKQSADYLKEISKTQKVLVGTEGFFGTLPDGLQMYLEGVLNITVIGVGQPIIEISPKLLDGLRDNKVFLVVNNTRLEIPSTVSLKLIASYPKAIASLGLREKLLLIEVTR